MHGLGDDAWRVTEMCLKVCIRRDVPGAADVAVVLARHRLPRVRAHAIRLLGVAGDTEHLRAAREAEADPDLAVRRAATRALDLITIRLDLPDP